ncbi:DUF1176 domain-containing protein [Caulobacter sp. LARHSG274]
MIGLVALGVMAAGATRAAPAELVQSFKDWAVVCDNLRTCQVAGFASEDSELPAVLRLSRTGQASAPARIEIDLGGEASIESKSLTLAIDGRAVMTTRAAASDNGYGLVTVLAGAQVGPLLGAARNGTLLSIRAGDKDLGQVSLAGMVAALRYVDDQQKRGGTLTAMIAKGPDPAASVPAPPVLPVLHAAPAIAQTGLPPKPPAVVQALAGCEVEPGSEGKPEAFRLSADKVLWQIPCGGGAYNFSSVFIVVDKTGRAGVAPLEGVDDGLATNADYDPKTRVLDAYDKGRGIGDCGNSSKWVWTGDTFELSESRVMPVCRGYGGDWPVIFRAKVQ